MARHFSQPIRIENSYLEFTNPSGTTPGLAPSGKTRLYANSAGTLLQSVNGGAFGAVSSSGAGGDTLTLGGDATLERIEAGVLSLPPVRIAATAGATLTGLLGGLYIRGSANNSTAAVMTVENVLSDTLATAIVSVKSATAAGGIIAYPATYATVALQDLVGPFAETSAAGMVFRLNATSQFYRWNAGGSNILTLTGASPAVMTLQDAFNIVPGTTTGLRIGTTATQKIGAFGATPIVRPVGWTAATGTATRTTFDTATVTTELLAQRVKALIDDQLALGWIGA